jgi:hypothetical protein
MLKKLKLSFLRNDEINEAPISEESISENITNYFPQLGTSTNILSRSIRTHYQRQRFTTFSYDGYVAATRINLYNYDQVMSNMTNILNNPITYNYDRVMQMRNLYNYDRVTSNMMNILINPITCLK